MHFNDLTNTNIIIYRNQFPIATCSSAYLGYKSVFLKDINLRCPIGTPLEVEFIDDNFSYINLDRVPMIINGTGSIGTSLKLQDEDKDKVIKWNDILSKIEGHSVKNVN